MKTGDKVIVPAEINGYGRDLRAMVTEIEKFAGAEMPSPLPVNPSPSSVVAFTLTCEISIPSAFAIFDRMVSI